MTRALAAIVLCGLPALAQAQTAPSEFARGAEIRAEGGTILRLALPDEVYETVTRADLADIRVLNAAGDAVPHTLRRPPGPQAAEAVWLPVPAFPMAEAQPGRAGRTQVRVDASGAVLEVTSDPGQRETGAYLVDVSAVEAPLTRLSLTWEAPADHTFLARVAVEASSDLNAWRTLVPSAAIAQLQRDAFTLTQNEIELPRGGERSKYLRITWPRDLAGVTLAAVRVRPRADATPPEIQWRTLAAERIETPAIAVYDARGLFPVEHLDVEFSDATDAASVMILSRATPTASWELRHGGLFYSLQEAGGAIRSSPASIAPTVDRYWSVQSTREGGWTLARAPRLRIGWHPHELVFVAQGAAPFMLVYGSARAQPADAPVEALLARLDEADRAKQVRAATLGPSQELGGAAALSPPPPLRQFALWGVLIVAVAILALVAVRAFREAGPERGDAI